ncbi:MULTISPECIES: SDR family NAD(P)-dependent oxidoreductase [Thiothrix]|jgi:NAD(P)-dependent dehydrogenase (short-subunit alcohol dehydrogenase family)|uniref:SDR family NAD(P)-dependent oxidoreductase n=1 Tax=Thiothrix lacustris TaxID=525917 RepID=A0ABY9MQB2_9GAMM|nr:SDR family NAD(P)-dependent oxidoreductase [Thiothrix lacustris]WML90824.1 SDR family NAD(P)-dependent oxidoreductase [Thiothrix lacustris]WMP17585.1 SDR family NAD(P)-dependent oxidoreductase [Thiothrix lacustris]
MKSSPSVAWLVGASSGIGQALAFQLAQAGWQVAISARRLDALQAMQAQHPALHPYTVDVTNVPSLHEAAAAITRELGEIELCVLNAGDYTPMPLADFNIELFRKLCDINYLGAVNGLDAIMPLMLARGRGQILLTASVAGYRGLPKSAPYSASKAAVISLAESLHLELKARGVLLRVVNPGFVRSPLTDKNAFKMPFLLEPEEAAQAIMRDLPRRNFEIAFPKRFVYLLKVLRLLPYWLYFKLTKGAL